MEPAAGHDHTVGLMPDGTVLAVGSNGPRQCDVSNWNLGPCSGRAEINGTWSTGIWYWNPVPQEKWIRMTSYTTSGDLTAGDVTGD